MDEAVERIRLYPGHCSGRIGATGLVPVEQLGAGQEDVAVAGRSERACACQGTSDEFVQVVADPVAVDPAGPFSWMRAGPAPPSQAAYGGRRSPRRRRRSG